MTNGHRPADGFRDVPSVRTVVSRVPAVTAAFWALKVLTTGMGETTSDFLAHRMDPVVAVGVGGVGLLVAMVVQLRAGRYVAWRYWFAVVMVSVFGTMVADGVHVQLGVPYAVSTVVFAVVLGGVFTAWWMSERTLSIHAVFSLRRELFYWASVVVTFTLGTAVGDLTATTLSLGYFTSGVVFAVVIAVPAVAYRWLGLDGVAAFWAAYIVTRPLGASFADWMGVSRARGGLDWGTGPVSLVLAVLIVLGVGWLAWSRRDVVTRAGRPDGAAPTVGAAQEAATPSVAGP